MFNRLLGLAIVVSLAPASLEAQASAATPPPPPRLAWHVPAADSVRVITSQVYRQGANGPLHYDLYLPARPTRDPMPVVVMFNGVQRPFRDLDLNVAWARLLAGLGLAAVNYDSDTSGTAANFDALIGALTRARTTHHLATDRLAVMAASANVGSALPLVSDSSRTAIRAAVMSYGTGPVTRFRADLPIRLIRVGLDEPGLQRAQDSLVAQALAANAPIEIVNHPSGEHPFEQADSRASAAVVEGTAAFLWHKLAPPFDGVLAAERDRADAGAAAYAGDWARAARAFAALVQRSPNDPELQRRLGDASLASGNGSAAITAYKRSRELRHWRRGDITVGMIAAYMQLGQRELAYGEIANFPSSWDKAIILAIRPQLAPYKNDPELLRRMR